jgi:GNAT superfamily N-acetyltransferase
MRHSNKVAEALKWFKDKYKAADGNGYLELSYKKCRIFLDHPNSQSDPKFTDAVDISGLTVYPEARGKGHGNRGMQQLCKWADDFGIMLKLRVEAYDGFTLNDSQLVKFYRKFGFKGNKDRMIRKPA